MAIDLKDRKIMEILEKNSRTSLSGIAKKIRSSPQTTHYRIDKLVEGKVITSFHSIVDHAYLNLIKVVVYFKVSYISHSNMMEIIDYFKKNRYVVSVLECGGNWDLQVSYIVGNISQFNKIFHNDFKEYPNQLSKYEIFFNIVTYFIEKDDFKNKFMIIGGDREPINLKKEDLLLLYNLGKNSRISIVELSKLVKKDPKTIMSKIDLLQKTGLIRKFTIEIDQVELGFVTNILLISYSKLDSTEEDKLVDFLVNEEEIVSFTKVIGSANLELSVKVKNAIALRTLLFRLREKFSSLITEIINVPVFGVHKSGFVPEWVIE